jgi:hypothetical protein
MGNQNAGTTGWNLRSQRGATRALTVWASLQFIVAIAARVTSPTKLEEITTRSLVPQMICLWIQPHREALTGADKLVRDWDIFMKIIGSAVGSFTSREASRPILGFFSNQQFARILAFAVLALAIHFLGTVLKLNSVSQSPLLILRSATVSWLMVAMVVLLTANLIGISFRTRSGLLVSIFSLAATGLAYFLWFALTQPDREIYQSDPFYRLHPEAMIPHPLGLVEARWWNLVVLAMVVILLIWETRVLVRTSQHRDPGKSAVTTHLIT